HNHSGILGRCGRRDSSRVSANAKAGEQQQSNRRSALCRPCWRRGMITRLSEPKQNCLIAFRLTSMMLKQIDLLCNRHDISRSQYLRRLVVASLEREGVDLQ